MLEKKWTTKIHYSNGFDISSFRVSIFFSRRSAASSEAHEPNMVQGKAGERYVFCPRNYKSIKERTD